MAQRLTLNQQIARSIRALPSMLAAGATGSAPHSECGGSRFEAWAASQRVLCARRSTDRIDRYERSDRGSSPCGRTNGLSSNRTGRGAPNAEMPVRLRRGRPEIARRWPTGKALGCLPRLCGFNSRPPRQKVCGVVVQRTGQRTFNPRTGVRLSSTLPLARSSVGRASGSYPEARRFEADRANQVSFRGSKAAMRLTVNQEMRRFESFPRSQFAPL